MSTDIHALAGAYALDAVDDLERAGFARHLAGCEACALEVAELRATTARLADSTWSVPPPRLRDTVLREVAQTRQVRPGGPDRSHGGPAAQAGRWRGRLVAAAAAVVLATGAGAATFAVQQQRVDDQRTAARQAASELARIQAVMVAADARARQVEVTGGGRLSVVSSRSEDTAVAMLSGLPAPRPDRAYQLWLMHDDGDPTDAGVLAAGQGAGVRLVPGVRQATQIAVTEEPAGGSAQPTTTPLASARLS